MQTADNRDPSAWAWPIVHRWQEARSRYDWTLLVQWLAGAMAGMELANPTDPRLSDLATLYDLATVRALAADAPGLVLDGEGRPVAVVV